MANTVLASTANSNMVDRPLWLQAKGGDTAVTYSGQDFRAFVQAMVPGEGVLGPDDFKVTQNGGGDGTVNVALGDAVIAGDGATNLGSYHVRSIGTVNLAIPSAGVGITRTHRVIIRVRDSQLDASTTYDWTLEVLEDTGSGTPAQPNSAITLALVARTGSNSVLTAGITDSRTLATVAGNRVERGIIGGKRYIGGTNLAAGFTSETSLNIATDTINLEANRRYRIHAAVVCNTLVTGNGVTLRIRETNSSGTIVGGPYLVFTTQGVDVWCYAWNEITTSSAVSKVYVMTGSAAGSMTAKRGDANIPVGIWVEDVGPAVPNTVTVV